MRMHRDSVWFFLHFKRVLSKVIPVYTLILMNCFSLFKRLKLAKLLADNNKLICVA